jgi:LPS-assembly lipoprotein
MTGLLAIAMSRATRRRRPVPAGHRRWLSLGLITSLTVLLAGCGFQPIYMPTAPGKPGVAQRELASVYVPVIPERPGQLLRQALQKRFGDDSGTTSAYDLRVSFSISGEGIAIQENTISSRIRFIGNASWTLVPRDAAQSPLTSGSARAMDAANIFDEQYFAADLETEAVQGRIAENIAQQIATQLAIWFRKQATQSAAKSG